MDTTLSVFTWHTDLKGNRGNTVLEAAIFFADANRYLNIFYANGLNLFTLSKEKLIDPELTSGTAYPLQRIINLGLTLTF